MQVNLEIQRVKYEENSAFFSFCVFSFGNNSTPSLFCVLSRGLREILLFNSILPLLRKRLTMH